MLLGLAALLLAPVLPLPVLAPVDQTMVLLVPAFAACALVGWWQGGRLSLALLWVALAAWIVGQPPAADAGFGLLARGWGVLLAGVFGGLCVLRPRRAFLDQALPAVGLALTLAVLALLATDGPLGARIEQTVLAEYVSRAAEWSAWLQRLASTPDWTSLVGRHPELAQMRLDVEAEYARLPGRSVQVLPAALALESLAVLAVAWALHQRLGRARVGPPLAGLRSFRFSDQLIWGLVVGVTMLVLPAFAEVRAVGVNLLLFFGALYVVRGLGVLSWLLAPRRWTQVLLVIIGLLQWPVLAAFALALGVGDTWLDWRRRTRPAP